MILLCLHRSKSVRSAAFVSVSRCLGSSSTLLLNFLEAFGHWQKHLETVKSLSLTEGESHTSMTEIKWNFHNTLLNLVSLGIDSRSEVLTSLLLKSYHPILQSSKNPDKLWKILIKRSSDILPTFQSAAEEVVGALLSPQGLESTDQNERKAALGALTTTAESFPEILFEKLLNWSQKKLEISDAEILTETDIFIWQTPEGRLSTETQSNIVIVPDDKKKHVKKKPKGRYRVSLIQQFKDLFNSVFCFSMRKLLLQNDQNHQKRRRRRNSSLRSLEHPHRQSQQLKGRKQDTLMLQKDR